MTPVSTTGATSRDVPSGMRPWAMRAPRATASAASPASLRAAASSMTGPTSTPASLPRPTRSFATAAVNRVTNASAPSPCSTPSSTMNRLAATQVCPALRNLATSAPATAASMSASDSTTNGALPPSSSDTRLMSSAAPRRLSRPTSVEPVKPILRIAGAAIRRAPARAPSAAGTTLTTPAGSFAASARRASASAPSGVCSAGLATTVHPAASAAPSLRASIAYGKFHGVISAHGPTGSRVTTSRWSLRLAGIVSP